MAEPAPPKWSLAVLPRHRGRTRHGLPAQDDSGNKMHGINFASQDYLSLSSHPAVKETAIETMREFGVHSAGSPALVGNTSLSLALERKIGDFLGMEYVSLFRPAGRRAMA